MKGRRRSSAGPMAEINLTPFIDVLLVLLILFMVAVPAARRSLDVSVPKPAPVTKQALTPAPVPVVSVHAGDFELNRDRHPTLESLDRGLQELLAQRNDRSVIVRSDPDVRYERVIAAMDAARGAGAVRIGVATAEAAAPAVQ